MGMFIDLIYNLILPAAKREGVDPDSVAKVIKNNYKEIDTVEKSIKKSFDAGNIKDKDGNVLKYDDIFPI